MKKDTLKEFMDGHRNQFDDRTPSEENWKRIAETVFGRQTVSLWNSVSIWRAAAVVLMGLSVYLFFSKSNPLVLPRQEAMQQDFTDIESFYANQITEKAALISHEGPFSDDSFTQDLQKLEAMYTVLKEEMKKHRSEKVKDALVLNMLVRLDLMNQQIQKLEESKKPKLAPASI